MLLDELKKANLQAMKDKDKDARSVLSVVLTKCQLLIVEANANGKEFNDGNVLEVIQKVLKDALCVDDEYPETIHGYYDDAERALDEAKAAINKILAGAKNIELNPQNQQIRKLQHALVEQHNLESRSVGEGKDRHLRIVGGNDSETN